MEEMYSQLFDLKHRNRALWNGRYGGEMIRIVTDQPKEVVAFSREQGNDRVITLINFSDYTLEVQLKEGFTAGTYTALFTGENIELMTNKAYALPAWGYAVYHQTSGK